MGGENSFLNKPRRLHRIAVANPKPLERTVSSSLSPSRGVPSIPSLVFTSEQQLPLRTSSVSHSSVHHHAVCLFSWCSHSGKESDAHRRIAISRHQCQCLSPSSNQSRQGEGRSIKQRVGRFGWCTSSSRFCLRTARRQSGCRPTQTAFQTACRPSLRAREASRDARSWLSRAAARPFLSSDDVCAS